MSENLVTFKGSKKGIYIFIKEGSFQKIKEQLETKLKESGAFFLGARVISFKGMKLSEDQKSELSSIIENKYGITVEEDMEEDDNSYENNITSDNLYFKGIDEGKTKFVKSTIRSGQSIFFDGNIVVLGDVNPGSEVIAKGNIVVLGALRGIAHAGSDGNREALVSAFSLQPTQLRIADIIARPPDNDELLVPKWPEIARIKDDIVLIEPYLTKNNHV